MTSYRVNDQKASARIVGMLQERDLVLRDLGYWSVAVFAAILGRGAFFLSRYRCGVSLFDRQGSPLELLSLLQSAGSFDQTVEVGQKERLPLRLVARSVPQPVAAERRRKLRADRDKRRRPSKEQLALLGWEIFVTNAPPPFGAPEPSRKCTESDGASKSSSKPSKAIVISKLGPMATPIGWKP